MNYKINKNKSASNFFPLFLFSRNGGGGIKAVKSHLRTGFRGH